MSRRDLMRGAAAIATTTACARPSAIASTPPSGPAPRILWGVQSGDVSSSSAVVWSRADRPARLVVEWSRSPSFDRVVPVPGPLATPETDLVAKVRLAGLPPGTRIHYRARFDGSEAEVGAFSTAPVAARDLTIAWSGDTNGQGWGIDESRGGMPAYAALAARAPDLFVHCGDRIYADNPIPAEITTTDGSTWRNLVDPAKDHVAETLDDFRGAHRYARRSAEVRKLSASVPLLAIWDDHEVRNNWFPGEVLDDERYHERQVDVLSARARRAMLEYTPTLAEDRLWRMASWGPLADVFLLDGRTHRTPNEPAPPEGGLLGREQAAWLLDALSRSRAVWKIVACNMPIGVVVSEPGKTVKQANDGWANQSGPPVEREVELAKLLSALRARGVKNMVWLTADVHYCAVHRLDPSRAAFKDFDPFYELVAGPMHASAFPRKPDDDTFGSEVVWSSASWDTFGSPLTGAQHFGLLRIDGRSHALHVAFVDAHGRDLHRLELPAAR